MAWKTLLLLGAVAASAQYQTKPRNSSWKLLNFTDGRVADVYVPACVNSDSPIIVGFHGLGFKKEQQPDYDHFHHKAEKECAVVVYPQGLYHAISVFQFAGFSWNAGGCCPDSDLHPADDVGFMDNVIDTVARDYGANGNLVFATGISNGAMMAHRWGCASERVKGVVGVAGPLVNGSGGKDGEMFECNRSLPLLYFHGTKDPISPYGGCNRTWSSFGHICPDLYKMGEGFAPNFPSVADFIKDRRILNGIDPAEQGATSFQNKSATCTSWGSTSNNVTLCTLEGMGHAWPNRDNLCFLPWTTCDNDIDATAEAWKFINRYRPQPKITLV